MVVTVDLDDTLALWQEIPVGWGYVWAYKENEGLIKHLLELQWYGAELYMVTFRGKYCGHRSGDIIIPENYIIDLWERYKLNFKGVIKTNGQCKVPFLEELNSSRHFDDDEGCILRIANNSKVQPILIRHNINYSQELEQLIESGKVKVFEVST